MPSITSWTRLEPRARRVDISDALQARLHDPLWLLGRQWQAGEFQGQNAGSPVIARMSVDAARLTRYRPGLMTGTTASDQVINYPDRSLPLETQVEREPVHSAGLSGPRLAAEAGVQWLRLLRANNVGQYRDAYVAQHPLGALVRTDDLPRPQALLTGLAAGKAGAVKDLLGRCPKTSQMLQDPSLQTTPTFPLSYLKDVVREFNAVISDRAYYTAALFQGVTLTAETAAWAQYCEANRVTVPPVNIRRLNRRLLEELLPGLIRPAAALDASARRFAVVTEGRLPDGALLYEDFRLRRDGSGPMMALPPLPAIADSDRAAVLKAANDWMLWYERLFSEPVAGAASAWDSERMEYRFTVSASRAAGEQVVMEAPHYTEGQLDWYAFDRRPAGHKLTSAGGDVAPELTTLNLLPSPVRFRGMPSSRWWEFEDGRINFGGLPAGTEDLARMLMVEFALIYGNDWFVAPVTLPVGSVGRINDFTVVDTFGQAQRIEPYRKTDQAKNRLHWRMYDLTGQPADDSSLFLVPRLGGTIEGEPVEEVLLLRDEMANMAWAVEKVVEGGGSKPLSRFEAYREALQQVAAAAEAPLSTAPLQYKLATTVPDYWFPLMPQRLPNSVQVRLLRGAVAGPSESQPLGRILEPEHPLQLREEEVPRSGARITRSYQYSRWSDGSAHLWVGRRKGAGRGEGASGLRFDVTDPDH